MGQMKETVMELEETMYGELEAWFDELTNINEVMTKAIELAIEFDLDHYMDIEYVKESAAEMWFDYCNKVA